MFTESQIVVVSQALYYRLQSLCATKSSYEAWNLLSTSLLTPTYFLYISLCWVEHAELRCLGLRVLYLGSIYKINALAAQKFRKANSK